MALMLSLAGRLAGRSRFLTRIAGRLVARELRQLKGKPVERQLLVYDLPETQLALANDLRLVDTILSDRAGSFPKARALERLLRPLIGGGVFGQPGGDPVRQARRLFVRALTRIPEQRVAAVATAVTRAYLADWQQAGRPVAIPSELSRLTIDIVSEASLGTRFTAAEGRRFVELFFEYHRRVNPVLLLLGSQDDAGQQALVERMGLAAIGAEMRELIRRRFVVPLLDAAPEGGQAPFATALLEAAAASAGADRTSAPDDARQTAMLDEIAVMLLAGHETTASVLSWLLWELAEAPAEQDEMAALIATSTVASTLADGRADAAVTRRLGALIQEALRLYPPIAFLLRQTTEAVTFRQRPICAGGYVVVSPWTIQRHRALWPQPDRFDPARWLAAGPPAATADRLAMIPFGYGPRVCPGKRFAEVEMHAILGELLGACRIARTRGRRPQPLGSLTSRPDCDFRLHVSARGAAPAAVVPAAAGSAGSPLPACPITGRPALRRVHGVSTRALAGMWRAAGAGDVAHLLPDAAQVALYESDTGLYFFSPRTAGDADFYRHFYASHGMHAALSADSHARLEFVDAARHVPAGALVLDVGCGSAAFAEHLPQATYRGLDPFAGPDAPPCVIRQGLAEHLLEASGRYDVVTAFQVIEHVADPLAFAAQLRALLRPGGKLILGVPLHPSPLTAIPNFLINAPPHHLSWWTVGALQALAEAIGVEPVEITKVAASPHEAPIYWMNRFSLLRAGPGPDERYFAHRWGWHLNLAVSYLLARLATRWLPLPRDGGACNVMLVARAPRA